MTSTTPPCHVLDPETWFAETPEGLQTAVTASLVLRGTQSLLVDTGTAQCYFFFLWKRSESNIVNNTNCKMIFRHG